MTEAEAELQAVCLEIQMTRESEFLTFLCEPFESSEYAVEVVEFVVENLATALRNHVSRDRYRER